jgi:hypothetical protein
MHAQAFLRKKIYEHAVERETHGFGNINDEMH